MCKLTVTALFALIACTAIYAEPGGMLRNPDFSAALGQDLARPAEWRMPGDGSGAWRRVNDDGPSGNFCLRYQSKTPRAAGAVTQVCACAANSEYELRFAGKSNGALRPLVRVIDAGDKTCLAKLTATGASAWKVQSTSFRSGAGTRMMIEIYADRAHEEGNKAPAGTVWVGDLRLARPGKAVAADTRAKTRRNLAFGKEYKMSEPNYSYCTDPGDTTQLTDGVYTKGYFWTQKTSVGWVGRTAICISIDLDRVEPIAGLSFSTAAGVAGVEWPADLLVLVSDDGRNWFEVGDLVRLSAQHSPPEGKYANHVFRTDALETHGRFVQIAAKPSGNCLFVDEIEVFRGDDALLDKPREGRWVVGTQLLMAPGGFDDLIKAQLSRDLTAAIGNLSAPALSARDRTALSKRARELASEIDNMPSISPDGFRAVLPMTDLEREIFRFQAAVWRSQAKPLLRVWKTHRWDPLAPSQEPRDGVPPPALDARMMNNEYRADVINLTNARDGDKQIRLRIEGLPGGTNPGYVAVHDVLAVGTRHFVAVSAALPPAERDGDEYVITVPAGMTRQVWFTFNPRDVKPGSYLGRVAIMDGSDNGDRLSAPVRLRVFPLRFPDKRTLLLGGWSYTDRERIYGVTPQNRDPLIAHLQEHCVNAPWASSSAMPSGGFDAQGNLVQEPNTRIFDIWVRRWHGAQRYMVFSNVRDSFAGSKIGTPLFEKKVASWICFWARHLRDLGLEPGQLALLLVDEPGRKEQYDIITAWAKAIKKAEPEVILWEDPQVREDETCLEMLSCVDVLVPYRRQWLERGDWHQALYLKQKGQGRELGFYSADGPARSFDPFSYYLVQHWHCFQIGGRWSGFWAFGDTGKVSVWNEYVARGHGPYCPVYLDDTSVTSAKYMEAIREGVQDYEYLVMLRDRIAELEKAGHSTAALTRAMALLDGACDRVLKGEGGANYLWDEEKDRGIADIVRTEILEALTALGGN